MFTTNTPTSPHPTEIPTIPLRETGSKSTADGQSPKKTSLQKYTPRELAAQYKRSGRFDALRKTLLENFKTSDSGKDLVTTAITALDYRFSSTHRNKGVLPTSPLAVDPLKESDYQRIGLEVRKEFLETNEFRERILGELSTLVEELEQEKEEAERRKERARLEEIERKEEAEQKEVEQKERAEAVQKQNRENVEAKRTRRAIPNSVERTQSSSFKMPSPEKVPLKEFPRPSKSSIAAKHQQPQDEPMKEKTIHSDYDKTRRKNANSGTKFKLNTEKKRSRQSVSDTDETDGEASVKPIKRPKSQRSKNTVLDNDSGADGEEEEDEEYMPTKIVKDAHMGAKLDFSDGEDETKFTKFGKKVEVGKDAKSKDEPRSESYRQHLRRRRSAISSDKLSVENVEAAVSPSYAPQANDGRKIPPIEPGELKVGMNIAAFVPHKESSSDANKRRRQQQKCYAVVIAAYDSPSQLYTVKDPEADEGQVDCWEVYRSAIYDYKRNHEFHRSRVYQEPFAIGDKVWSLYRDEDTGVLSTEFYIATVERVGKMELSVRFADGDHGNMQYGEVFKTADGLPPAKSVPSRTNERVAKHVQEQPSKKRTATPKAEPTTEADSMAALDDNTAEDPTDVEWDASSLTSLSSSLSSSSSDSNNDDKISKEKVRKNNRTASCSKRKRDRIAEDGEIESEAEAE